MTTHREIALQDRIGLILCGNEYRHLEIGLKVQQYMAEEAGISDSEIIKCAYLNKATILERTANVLGNLTSPTSAIVFYIGHGSTGYMAPNRENPISYEKLAQVLGKHRGHFMFVNASCHSWSAIPVFESNGLLPSKGLVIAGCKEEEALYAEEFIDALLYLYKARMPLRKLQETLITCYIPDFDIIEQRGKNAQGQDIIYLSLGSGEECTETIETHTALRKGKKLDYLLYPRS